MPRKALIEDFERNMDPVRTITDYFTAAREKALADLINPKTGKRKSEQARGAILLIEKFFEAMDPPVREAAPPRRDSMSENPHIHPVNDTEEG